MAKGEHLSVERGPAQEEASERRQKNRKNSSHRPISLTQIPEILNDSAADHVLGRHRHLPSDVRLSPSAGHVPPW